MPFILKGEFHFLCSGLKHVGSDFRESVGVKDTWI